MAERGILVNDFRSIIFQSRKCLQRGDRKEINFPLCIAFFAGNNTLLSLSLSSTSLPLPRSLSLSLSLSLPPLPSPSPSPSPSLPSLHYSCSISHLISSIRLIVTSYFRTIIIKIEKKNENIRNWTEWISDLVMKWSYATDLIRLMDWGAAWERGRELSLRWLNIQFG